MKEKPPRTAKGKPAPPEWSKFRLDADTLAGLDAIAVWLGKQGIRQPRRGPAGASRADALRVAVQHTAHAINANGAAVAASIARPEATEEAADKSAEHTPAGKKSARSAPKKGKQR